MEDKLMRALYRVSSEQPYTNLSKALVFWVFPMKIF